ncbi:MAG: hypothetical protein COV72_08305 [Candidatus Omnitrophica bacterium CG11_big_fil_rev_8_21_14_0_20_42_13]|uniref:Nitroreductase domain-containing protein n=1 Tax=Candidatus Ghiorseimicrobium undicola TaxID=1974746 RepID=A0A2H0LVP0_9BACT|nr:MAG: hypothetical protein COV72_08305 [Candidatus Omnitrophica bacterium CG11_big_fil_rev_8_21_14_0_20_42_13]
MFKIYKYISFILLFSLCVASCADKKGFTGRFKRRDPEIGREFHEKTKMAWGTVAKTASELIDYPPQAPYKSYRSAKEIKLPELETEDSVAGIFTKNIFPLPDFSGESITLNQLSRILFSADGIVKEGSGRDVRTAPVPLPQTDSFSFMHPVEIYVLASNVSGLEQGLYHYSFLKHSLELINAGHIEIPNCCFGPEVLKNCSALIILTGIPGRFSWVYDARSWRYMYMAAGAISQNIHLACGALGLNSFATASFDDDVYSRLLGIDGKDEAALLLHLIGNGQ